MAGIGSNSSFHDSFQTKNHRRKNAFKDLTHSIKSSHLSVLTQCSWVNNRTLFQIFYSRSLIGIAAAHPKKIYRSSNFYFLFIFYNLFVMSSCNSRNYSVIDGNERNFIPYFQLYLPEFHKQWTVKKSQFFRFTIYLFHLFSKDS